MALLGPTTILSPPPPLQVTVSRSLQVPHSRSLTIPSAQGRESGPIPLASKDLPTPWHGSKTIVSHILRQYWAAPSLFKSVNLSKQTHLPFLDLPMTILLCLMSTQTTMIMIFQCRPLPTSRRAAFCPHPHLELLLLQSVCSMSILNRQGLTFSSIWQTRHHAPQLYIFISL